MLRTEGGHESQIYGDSVSQTGSSSGVKNPPTLFVMVGLPAAGKTTRAKQIEEERRALRLTPDEWMIPLFGESEADGKRDVLEGRLIWLALQVLENDIDVVLDFGLWSRDCLLYTSPSPRDRTRSRMPSS